MIAENGNVILVGQYRFPRGAYSWDLSEAPARPDETEKLQVARVPFWDAVDRVKRGEIRDAISVAALVRVALMALQGELPEQIAKAIGRRGAGD